MIIDITRTVQEAPIYPGSLPVEINRVLSMKDGSPFNVSVITTNSHMGTHADAYCHCLRDNDITIDRMELWRYYGACRVITVERDRLIPAAAFEGRLEGIERIAIHGGGMSYLTSEAAKYIIDAGVKTVVTDAWSVSPLDNEYVIHSLLLTAGIAIVENVILDGVEDGDYTLCAFPVKYGGCDGAPVRAVLIHG